MFEVPEILQKLKSIVSERNIIIDPEDQYTYTLDCTSGKYNQAICILKPESTEQISDIIKFCNEIDLKVKVRGGGSGVTGGSSPWQKCIVISLENLNQIIEINTFDRFIIAESGVNTHLLQSEVLKKGLVFPQNISSAKLSQIGGNIAVSSGSPKSLKYGTTKDYVLNLEVVLPNGDIIWTGRNITKNASGYNLTQLFVGSEGTLGVITKVVLKLVPPSKEMLLRIPFTSSHLLFEFVKCIFNKGFSPSSLEFLDKNGINLTTHFLKKNNADDNLDCYLWIEFEFNTESEKYEILDSLQKHIDKYSKEEILIAETKNDISNLWELRKNVGNAAVNYAEFIDFDFVVSRSKIEVMYSHIEQTCKQLGLEYIIIGHIGDGNFHVNVFRDKTMGDLLWKEITEKCARILLSKAVYFGGEISGEHGIGVNNKKIYNDLEEVKKIELLKKIKSVFDANNILNSDNIFDQIVTTTV